ncbi:MAG: type I-U CRISPR-associated helicase/endonuclease Cas3 [Sphingomonadaceae bacterium]
MRDTTRQMRLGEQFSTAFRALQGNEPYRWQQRMFDQICQHGIPSGLDLPTGLGKTSVMTIWLIGRAFGAKLPRRLVYVVDRRVVLDQATEEAEKLRRALEGGASYLKARLGLGTRNLPICTLRGAHCDDREWLDDPAAPAIIVGTVDMIGSRLMFSGYGVSSKMRPYHAGLLGTDALIVLDEAHLMPPFEGLLEGIATAKSDFGPRPECSTLAITPFKVLSLSSTGRERGGEIFRLDASDLDDQLVAERLRAPKKLQVVRVGHRKVEEVVADQAWQLSANGEANVRCLIYCDSRETAESTNKALRKVAEGERRKSLPKTSLEIELFVGATRVKERDELAKRLADHGFLADSNVPREHATFLIATSEGEVGIDLDADHMVCDLVSWERMVQRLGRVNRRGKGNARVIVVSAEEPKPKKPDEPTQKERREIVAYRSLAVIAGLPSNDGLFDASPGALWQLAERARNDAALKALIDAATTPEPLRPALNRALVDAWSMTSLEAHTGRPEVTPWLRGWVEEEPQTTIVWRKHLPVRIDDKGRTIRPTKKGVETFFEAASPHESEKLETPTYRVGNWIQARARMLLKHQGSQKRYVEEFVATEALAVDNCETAVQTAPRRPKPEDIVALILKPNRDYVDCYTLSALAGERSGGARDEFENRLVDKIIVLDAHFGGLRNGLLDSRCEDLPDTADHTENWCTEARFRVRKANGSERERVERQQDEWRFEYEFVLRRNGEGTPLERLVVEHFGNAAQTEDARSILDWQELAEHQACTRREMSRIARTIGVLDVAANALAVAASLHDEGKKAVRWQRAFKAPREKRANGSYKIFAKTPGPIDQATLNGYRHEFGSLSELEKNDEFNALADDWRDLVQHLVAAHHGFARPLISTHGCEGGPPSLLTERAQAVALRFSRLQKRWGPWGLAWWESLLRAADQQATRTLDELVKRSPQRPT